MKHKMIKRTAALGSLLASLFVLPASAAENPMDNAGIQHNLYLGCLQDIGANQTNALALVVDKCGYNPGTSREEFIKQGQPIVDMDPMQPLAEKMSPFRGRFSAYEFSFFERIDGVVRNAKDLSQAEAMFADLESEAIEQLDPKTHGGANVLATLSVARHSLRYWTEYASKADPTHKRKWWHWVVIGIADAAGLAVSIEIGVAAVGVAGAASETANELIHMIDP